MLNQPSLLEPASRKRSIGKPNARYPCWWDPCFLLDPLIMSFSMNCVKFLMQCPFWVSCNHTHFKYYIFQLSWNIYFIVSSIYCILEFRTTKSCQPANMHFYSRMNDDCKPWIGFCSLSLSSERRSLFLKTCHVPQVCVLVNTDAKERLE